jgi:hypothetical protein
MDRCQILDLYQWGTGVCVRHPTVGPVDTARAGVIHVQGGEEVEVRVCQDCMLALEEEAAAVARRKGWRYRPGLVGETS